MSQKIPTLIIFLGFVLTACLHAPVPTASTPLPSKIPQTKQEEPLALSVEKMKAFMKENPVDPDIALTPLPAEQSFEGKPIKTGQFKNINYMTSGNVSLQKKGDVYFIIFEENFSTPAGPDLKVYLTKNTEPTQRTDILQGLDLGKLKSTKGKQMYSLPSNIDLNAYHSVSIHCKAFNVPWSYAII